MTRPVNGKCGEGRGGEKLDNNQTASSVQQTGRFSVRKAASPPYPVPRYPSSIPLLLPRVSVSQRHNRDLHFPFHKMVVNMNCKTKGLDFTRDYSTSWGWREEKERQYSQPWYVWKGLNRKRRALFAGSWTRNSHYCEVWMQTLFNSTPQLMLFCSIFLPSVLMFLSGMGEQSTP